MTVEEVSGIDAPIRLENPVLPLSRTMWVADRIRKDIFSGELEEGTRLRNKDLVQRYAISATPLREALQLLSVEGLIEAIPQHGARVSSLKLEEALDLYELRLLLEPRAIRRSLLRAPDERFEELEGCYKMLTRAGNHIDESFYDVHNHFHRLMRMDCDSTWLLRVVDQLTTNCERYRRLRHISPSVVAEHEALHVACQSRDSRTASKLMRDHIANTRDTIRKRMSTD